MKYLNVFVICVGLAIAGPVHNPRQYTSANKIESICKERGWPTAATDIHPTSGCELKKRDCEKKGKVDEELLTCLNVIGKNCNADSECGDGYTCRPNINHIVGGKLCEPRKEEKPQEEQKETGTPENTLTADVKKICETRGWPTAATDIHPTSGCELKKRDCEKKGKVDEELLTCLNVIGKNCNADSECGDGYTCRPNINHIVGGKLCEPRKEEKPQEEQKETGIQENSLCH